MRSITRIKNGINAIRKAAFTDVATGTTYTEAQMALEIGRGANLDNIMITNDISLNRVASMLKGLGSEKDEILKQAYTALFTAEGHADAEQMADEIINGTDIATVVRRHAAHDVIIKSGRAEFDSAEEAADYVATLTKEGKRRFFSGLKTVVKVNGVEEDEVPLGDFFKKNKPAVVTMAAPDPDDTDPDDTEPDEPETASGRALILVAEDTNIGENDEVKMFAANLTVYGESKAIKAITSGEAATIKAVTKVEGVSTADLNFFSHGSTVYARLRNELAENVSLFGKSKSKNSNNS